SLIFSGKNTTHILDEMLQKGKAGGTPKSSNRSYYQGDIPFLSIADMTEQGKYIYKTEKHISENGLQNSTAWIVPANSLILSMYASYGFVSINKVPLATSQALFNMVVKRSVNVEYIYYYLLYLANTDYYIKMVSTGTQPNLNAEKVKAIPLYLPPLNKQEYIVKLLQSYDNRLTMEEKILTHLQSQKLALLQQLFI
uniref:restriction endonuclease subunit S n=1 Tax=Helicobacter japonicus TaxID=425400 RepID=UPI00262E8479